MELIRASLNNIQYIGGGAGRGLLKSNRYDRALLITVLGEIPDRKAALEEIYNSLKPGGLLLVTEVIADQHFQNRKSVTRLAASAGFIEKENVGNRVLFSINFIKP